MDGRHGLYERAVRPSLFLLPAERAHGLAQSAFRSAAVGRILGGRAADAPHDPVGFVGLELRNRIGLSAGLDKDGTLLRGLARLPFGLLTIGSVTFAPRTGNPRPRLVRYPDERAIGNSMGLPGPGAATVARNLSRRPRTVGPPVIVSVAGSDVHEMQEAARILAPHADALEFGLICPNSVATERMGEARMLQSLLAGLEGIDRPVLVKIPPYDITSEQERARSRERVAVCQDQAVAAITVGVTEVRTQPALALGSGSYSGQVSLSRTVRIVAEVAEQVGGALPIKASGGIHTGRDARQVLDAGATVVEVYAAFVYRGPRVARRIHAELEAERAGTTRG